jgi:N-sulfoglucosamine sulfohydrolase
MNVKTVACLLVLVAWSCSTAKAAARNVVLFVTDDQSPDAGCYGNSVIRTPNMDELARDGTLFTQAFCTTASCSASRSVILTGLHNHANGQYGHQHGQHKFSSFANIASLPVLLSRAGYRTARCGKYHVAPESVYHFDQVIPGPTRNPVVMAENCRAFLEAESDHPFLLYFCTSDPHRDGRVAEELPHRPNRFGNPAPGGKAFPGVQEVIYRPDEVLVPGFLPDTPTCRAELAQYYQSVSRIDQGLGRLMDVLKDDGKWDETLFVFISDHGMAMPGAKTTVYEGGLRSPCIVRNPYNPRRNITSNVMVSWVDIAPTILDFAGALDRQSGQIRRSLLDPQGRSDGDDQAGVRTEPGALHGRSFVSVLDQEDAEGWDKVFASHTFHEIQMYYPMRAIRTRKYKLIWNIAHPLPFPFASDLWAAPTWQAQYRMGPHAPYGMRTVDSYIHRPVFELYDVINDPHEGKNLAEDAAYADVLAKMQSELRDFQQRTRDPWIIKWRYE